MPLMGPLLSSDDNDVGDDDDDWLRTIWDAVDHEIALLQTGAIVDTIDTIEVKPPQPQPETAIAGSQQQQQQLIPSSTIVKDDFVPWEYEILSPRPIMDYPLNISTREPRELATCVSCHTEISVMVLHDDSPQHHQPRLADLTCVKCWVGGDTDGSDEKSLTVTVAPRWKGNRKKRKTDGAGTRVWCDVCRHLIAHGGMRLIDTADERRSEWTCVDFRVEHICRNCARDFS